MAWEKADGDKAVSVGENGYPLWISDEEGADKTPVEVNWSSALQTIARLNGENKTKREEAKKVTDQFVEATEKLKLFGDIDPKTASEAVIKLKSIDESALLTADKVESFKASILQAAESEKTNLIKGYDEKLEGFEKSLSERDAQIYKLVVSNAFKSSPYIKKLNVPASMIEAYFSPYFKVEEGLPVGHLNGNKINSRKNPGNTASFDEAIEIIIEQYPDKNMLFPGSGGGSGGSGGAGGAMIGKDQIKGMSLAEYEAAKKEGRIPQVISS